MERRRHAQPARKRPSRRTRPAARQIPIYRSAVRRTLTDIYDVDHVARGAAGRFRWLLSTCLAAIVGAFAIGVMIFGSLDRSETQSARLPSLQEMIERPREVAAPARSGEGLNWSAPKVDRLQSSTGAMTAKHIIHEQIQVKRDGRPFIDYRPYLRVSARLTPVPPANSDIIPAFNPLKLYASADTVSSEAERASDEANPRVQTEIVELLTGILPGEDGQEVDAQEARQLALRALEDAEPLTMRPTLQPERGDGLAPKDLLTDGGALARRQSEPVPTQTTVIAKTAGDRDEIDEVAEKSEVRVSRVQRGDTLTTILQRMGADIWQAKAMSEAAKSVFADSQLTANHEVHVTVVPSLQRPGKLEPAAYSVYGDGHVHRVSVSRNTSGEFVANTSPHAAQLARAALANDDQPQSSSLYAAFYNAALMQGVPPETVMQILRIHAPETDFRRRVRSTDGVELFFDAKPQPGSEPVPGELLFTALSGGGEVQRYWRFRSNDGVVDYYDEFGNNSRKFLQRRPVRGDNIRFSSGYGIRLHPLLNERRMHLGVDWAAPIGTPIIAAGNGVVEFADRKSEYGNHIRIRHANAYQTTYSHLSRFGNGIREGVRVRQGQVIGFVGNTGLSAGPHLHFEVLVSNRHVDPMQIQVPRERRLTGKQASDFQRERQRIDDLMRRPPVLTLSR